MRDVQTPAAPLRGKTLTGVAAAIHWMSRRVSVVVRDAIRIARSNDLGFAAAALAYYVFVALIPLLVMAFTATSLVFGESLATAAAESTRSFLVPTARDVVLEAFTGASGRVTATLLSFLVFLWSATNLFRGIDDAFGRVYGSGEKESFLHRVMDSVIVLTAVVSALMLMALAGTMSYLSRDALQVAGSYAAVLVGLTLVFTPIYYFLPDVSLSVKQVLPGAAFTSLGLIALQAGFGFYVEHAAQYSVYGVFGGVLLLVIWFYLGSLVLLLGAAVNAALIRTVKGEGS